jgi:hypothetical protein
MQLGLLHVVGHAVADLEYRCAAMQWWVLAAEERLRPWVDAQ